MADYFVGFIVGVLVAHASWGLFFVRPMVRRMRRAESFNG